MPTIFDPGAREDLFNRFARLTAQSKPVWGRMNAVQMVRHCHIAVDMLLGIEKVAPRSGPLRLAPLRYLIIHVLPWPKGVPTAPELITTSYAGDWAADLAKLRRSVEAMAGRGENGSFSDHPAFGRINGRDIGVLMHKHLDHHLRQFGAG